jgi:16S rRNA (cytidine1402-2'-O)-methyltransferase
MGTLYLVATPIGNLEDITIRALRTLRDVRLIAAEDTRHTKKLLTHFDLHTELTSYYEHNKLTKLDKILKTLADGDVALVSDAGTPALNDPGYELVCAALEAGYAVSPIPGPTAPIAALVASGLPTENFLYLGYLPRKAAERQRMLENVRTQPYTLIFLETPHRLAAALKDLLTVFGERQIAVGREITKLHEEFFRGTLAQAEAHFGQVEPRGEITLVVEGYVPVVEIWDSSRLETTLVDAMDTKESPAQIARRLAVVTGWPRREIYQRLLDLQAKSKQPSKGEPDGFE